MEDVKQWQGNIVAKINSEIENIDLRKASGYEILFLIGCDPKKAILISPMDNEKADEFWEMQFQDMKDWVSDNKKEFLEAMLTCADGMICYVGIDDLVDIRQATAEDGKTFDATYDYLIEKYGLDRDLIKEQ